jgi:hypothetical protein
MLLPGATGSTTASGPARLKVLALCVTLALGMTVAISLYPPQAAAQQQPDAQTLAEQAIHRLDLQTELRREDEPPQLPRLNLPPETVWIAVIVGIIILAYAFRDLIPVLRAGRGGAWQEDEAASLAAGGPRPAEVVLEAADDLAAQGRFVDAMHVLLLQALADIRRRLDEEFADSLTSREILRSRQLSEVLRRPLREVISRVEWTYFGGHSANRDDYLACRASFSTLAQALLRGAAA